MHEISRSTAQTHSSIMADMSGDGRKDYITGRRFLAHNGNDAGDGDAPILMWFDLHPKKAPYYTEHIIDSNPGVGLNIAVKDMNKDKKLKIIIANKNGVFLLVNGAE